MPMTIDGNGTISGLNAGGLPAATVVPATLSQPMTLGTAQNTTSGTSIDFTGVPSWVKRVTVCLNDVSTNGASSYRVLIGPVGGVETSGYITRFAGFSGTGTPYTDGMYAYDGGLSGASVSGSMIFTLQDSATNTWVVQGTLVNNGSSQSGYLLAGKKALAGVLSRIRLTTVNGTDTFDAGSVNILYEG